MVIYSDLDNDLGNDLDVHMSERLITLLLNDIIYNITIV
jgi:hypothetical protein